MVKCYLLDDIEGWLHQTGPHHAVVDPLLRKKKPDCQLLNVSYLSAAVRSDLFVASVSWNGCFKLSDAVVSCQLSSSAVRTLA
jgi:hypothetical protein